MKSGHRLNKPSIQIGALEYQCASRSVKLEPGDHETFCDMSWEFSVELELSYGDATGEEGTWNTLSALRDQTVTVVLQLESGSAASATNPTATFEIVVPAIPFMTSAGKAEKMTMSFEAETLAEPVFSTGT